MAKENPNLKIYEAHRNPPKEALKPISAGRLKGMTDINPMWRIKALTEEFGACGIGWYYETTEQRIEDCGNEKVAIVNINLYIKDGDKWSMPIFGTGGSKIVTMESKGAYVSDEAFKMATTDALSVACKQLGFAADIYWQTDRDKYTANDGVENKPTSSPRRQDTPEEAKKNEEVKASVDPVLLPTEDGKVTDAQRERFNAEMERTGITDATIKVMFKVDSLDDLSQSQIITALNKFAKTPDKK